MALAALMQGPGKPLQVANVGIHQPRSNEVLIKNHAVAIQPLDAKTLHAGYGPASRLNYPAILGTSGAGIVEAVGTDVTCLQKGDRVVFDTGAYIKLDDNKRSGTWQQHVVCGIDTVAKIGDGDFEQAVLASFPLQTAVAALHVFLGMSEPSTGSKDDKVLVWGAGGAVGSYAVQFAKSVGHTVIVTASPRDTERQKRLGASEVVDYKSADAVQQLRKLGPYKYLITASGDGPSQTALGALLSPNGGRFASVLPKTVDLPSNVEIVYDAFSQIAQKIEYRSWRKWWYQEYFPNVFSQGLIESLPYSKIAGGLSALQSASQDVFDGKIRGKLVIDPQET